MIPVLTRLPIGTYGPYVSDITDPSKYTLQIQNAADWPSAGDVLKFTFDVNDGSGWRFDAAMTIAGGPWIDRKKRVEHLTHLRVGLGEIAANRIRVTLEVLQACTFAMVRV